MRFKSDTGEVEFAVTVGDEPLHGVTWDPEFSEMVNGEPAALALNKAIFGFHEARNFQYPDEPTGTTGTSQSGKAPKKAGAEKTE